MNPKMFFQRRGSQMMGILSCLLLSVFIVLPLGFVIETSFVGSDGVFSLASYQHLFREENLKAILNSLLLGISVVGMSSLIALPCAYILSRTKLRKFYILDILLMIPFMIPPYINSMGWMEFMGRNGILVRWNPVFKPLCSYFSTTFFGMVFIMSLHTAPFLMTMMKNAFLSFPRSLDDANSIYSDSKLRSALHVGLPILLPNYAIGAFLVFVKALSEYGTPATFGTKINFPVFSTLITDYMQVSPIDFSMASALASLLLVLCLSMWLLEMFVTDKFCYPLRKERQKEAREPLFITICCSLFLLVVFVVSCLIPLYSIFSCSIKKISYYGFSKDNLTMEYYHMAFFDETGFGNGYEAILHSFLIGFSSCLIILFIGFFLVCYFRKNPKKRLSRSVEFLSTIPQMVPNIVLGIGLIMLYSTIRKSIPIYGTPFMLVIGYSIAFLPTMISYIKNALIQVPGSILEASRLYARNGFVTDLKVLLPLSVKGAFYGFMMTLIVTLRELVLAKLLQPSGYYTISLFIDFQYQQGNQQAAMAFAVISVLITLVILIPLEILFNHRKKIEK